jgi:ATP-binding cassette subfamily B protein
MTSYALSTSPTRPRLGQYWELLVAYLRPQRGRVALLGVLLLASIALQLINPQIIGRFLDAARGGAPGQNLGLAGLAFIGIGVLQRAVALASVYVGENTAWAATNGLRANLTRHCLGLDMPFHKQHTPGELIERIDGDAASLANFFSQFAIRVLGNGLLIAGVLLLLFREDLRLGLGMTLYAVATLLALGALQDLATSRWGEQRQSFADLFGFVEERYNGIEDIRASGAEAYVMNGLYKLMRTVLRKGVAAWMFNSLSFVATNFLFLVGYALGLGLGAYLYLQGTLTVGAAYLVVYYIGMIAAPLEDVRRQAQDLGAARASLGRALDLLSLQSEVRSEGSAQLPTGPLGVDFRGLSFAYDEPDADPAAADPEAENPRAGMSFALRDISFTLPPGRLLGLLGRTGSGKTTLTRLLFRLYDPAAGSIHLGGVDIRDLPLSGLRRGVGMITQDVQLFQASIRDNLAFFNQRINDDRIEYALRELGLWEWVQRLPAGLDTPLGPGGQGLSAGEAQLLAFARVFLKDPGLILLDEASSRLDPATEALLERAIDRLLRGRTAIIIAHRLHTVQRADDILILDNGRTSELGERAALAADPGSRFAHLLRTGLEEALV